jgi:hypothetical protein
MNRQCFHRATFQSPYIVSKALRSQNGWGTRLGDQLLTVAESGSRDFLQEANAGEFSVFDLATLQKAWFEKPQNATPEQIEMMIEGHFDATALQVAERLWVVLC